MGVDYSQGIDVGVEVSREDLIAPFRQIVPEVARYEDRYDPKTGERLEPKKIVERRSYAFYVFENEKYEEARDLAYAIAKKLDCSVESHADWMCGGWDEYVFGYGLGITSEDSRCSRPSSISLSLAVEQYPKLLALKDKLTALGIKATGPSIVNSVSVS